MRPSPCAMGIDLGGTSVKSVAVSFSGQLLKQANTAFEPAQQLDWAEKIRDLVLRFKRELGGESMVVGLAAPGLAATDERSISYMPGRLQGLEKLNWTDQLRSRRPVPVLNDAHAALLGEIWLGAARGFTNVFLLTLGTGVGGAAMVDGNLLRGHIGRAGHLGHMSLDPNGAPDITRTPGSLEDAIGNCTVSARSEGRFQATHELIQAHRSGDTQATRIWLQSIKALAAGVASLVNILDPEAVIIGGGIAKAEAALFEPLQAYLSQMEWRPGGHGVRVLPAELGELAGAYGAAWKAIQENPQPL